MKILSLMAVRLPGLLALLACTGLFATLVIAQPPGNDGPGRPGEPDRPPRERGPGPEGPGAFLRMLPLMKALDADGSGDLSEAEIQNATAALKALDKNGDGKLTEDELRPEFGRFGEGGPRGPGFGGPGFSGPGFGGPGFGRPGFGRPDRREGDRRAEGPREGTQRDQGAQEEPRPEGRREDRPREEGRREEGRREASPERRPEPREQARGEGRGPGRGEPRGEGRPDAENRSRGAAAMVDRMLEFDTDKDGMLSRDELIRMIEQGAPGGRGGMGFGFGGDRPDAGSRPRRPAEE